MSPAPIRIMGVDTALRSTGVGLIEAQGQTLQALEYGCITTSKKDPLSVCLENLAVSLRDLLLKYEPSVVAIEGIFHCRNVKTAIMLGEARGAVIVTCAEAGLKVFEYAPRRVKQAVSGSGAASKEQVGRMVQNMLGLSAVPQEDAGDALAIAICHHHASSGQTPVELTSL